MILKKVSVFDFDDFRKYLEAYQAQRQSLDPSFTRTQFCKELGLPNTRSYFNDIVKGKRHISKSYVERFIQTIGLDTREAQYFRIMVYFNQSTYEEELEDLLGPEMTLEPWRGTAIFESLEKRLCLDLHKLFQDGKSGQFLDGKGKPRQILDGKPRQFLDGKPKPFLDGKKQPFLDGKPRPVLDGKPSQFLDGNGKTPSK